MLPSTKPNKNTRKKLMHLIIIPVGIYMSNTEIHNHLYFFFCKIKSINILLFIYELIYVYLIDYIYIYIYIGKRIFISL